MMSKDIEILRKLANELAEIAAQPQQQETKRLWKKLNALIPERPMYTIDQICWHEMNVDDALTLQCEDSFYRELETNLRRLLYRNKYLKDDYVYEAAIYIPTTVRGFNSGLEVQEDTLILTADKEAIRSHHFYDQLKTEADLEKLQVPDFWIDKEMTNKQKEMAQEAVGDILEVIMDGVEFSFGVWDRLVEWRGFDNLLEDITYDTDFILQTVEKATDVHLRILDRMEEMNLLPKRPQRIHCSGAFTDELPQTPDADPMHPRAADSWTFGLAQILYLVSPKMHNELEFEFAKKWFSRFGLGYYGCCEPLDDRLSYVKQIPNVRKISCSPWVKNYERFAEELEGKYVMSHKPAPALLVDGQYNPDRIRSNMQILLDASNKYNCPCEFLLKDLSTINGKPARIFEWSRMADEMLRKS